MNKYYKELEDIAKRAGADDTTTSLVIAQTIHCLQGVMASPLSMQVSFSKHLHDFAITAKAELEMLQSGRLN